MSQTGGARTVPAATSPPAGWGGLEIGAVLGLTIGVFVVPVLAPVVGLALAWSSQRWTRREKVVATALSVLPALLVAAALVAMTVSGSFGDPPTTQQSVAVERAP